MIAYDFISSYAYNYLAEKLQYVKTFRIYEEMKKTFIRKWGQVREQRVQFPKQLESEKKLLQS